MSTTFCKHRFLVFGIWDHFFSIWFNMKTRSSYTFAFYGFQFPERAKESCTMWYQTFGVLKFSLKFVNPKSVHIYIQSTYVAQWFYSNVFFIQMMKSYIWLQTADGSIQQVEQEVAIFCPLICHEIHAGMGSSKTYPISLPARVNPVTLSLILDYCRFHQVPGRSNKVCIKFKKKNIFGKKKKAKKGTGQMFKNCPMYIYQVFTSLLIVLLKKLDHYFKG